MHSVHFVSSFFTVAALGLALLASHSCGGGSPPSTTAPPAPSPTPSSGGGGGVGASCRIGDGSPEAACGSKTAQPRLLHYVETAIDLLVQEKPKLFDLNDVAVANTGLYKVLDAEAYLEGVVANIRRQGACSERDADDWSYERILVKDTNDFSETYDVLLASGYIRRNKSAFVDTCVPASFPVDRAAIDAPPAGSGCGRPYPPPVTRLNCKVHLRGIEYYTLDSTPMVGPNVEYCAAIGYTDGRSLCPVRPEGAPDRIACELWRVGKAKDTGRPGPTWTIADTGAYCTGSESGCQNHPDNQFQLWVSQSGRYRVAAENGAECVVNFVR